MIKTAIMQRTVCISAVFYSVFVDFQKYILKNVWI